MQSGMEWALFGAGFVFVFVLLAILGEWLRQKRKLKMQEILQKERIMAWTYWLWRGKLAPNNALAIF